MLRQIFLEIATLAQQKKVDVSKLPDLQKKMYLTLTLQDIDPVAQEALQIYNNDTSRGILESLLLANVEADEIGQLLKIKQEVLDFYCKVFYNTDNCNRLSIEADISVSQGIEKTYKRIAVKYGADILKWILFGTKPQQDILDVLEDELKQSFFRIQCGMEYDNWDQRWMLAIYNALKEERKNTDQDSPDDLAFTILQEAYGSGVE
jgi:hypothetical protein